MNRFFVFVLLTISISLPSSLFGAHMIGGSLSWECISSGPDQGKFVFTVLKYRKCQTGSAGGLAATSINHPFGAPIPTVLVSQRDISPGCYDPATQYDCFATGTGSYEKTLEAIEEFIFKSAPVIIDGTPDAAGSVFYTSDCCRPGAFSYTNSSDNNPFVWQAIMYPYYVNGVAQPLGTGTSGKCYDSSPRFAEKPLYVSCRGIMNNFSDYMVDPDHDELTFHWSSGWTLPNTPNSYKTGYTFDSPLPSPGVPLSPTNVAATLDSITGNLNFMSNDSGYYIVNIRMNAYRCGQLISKTYREIPVFLVNCPPLPPPFSGIKNQSPQIQFAYKGIPSGKVIKDTVYAGDRIQFELSATDAGILPGAAPQTIIIKPVGNQYGTLFSDSLSGCNQPPCALVDTGAPSYNSMNNDWRSTGSNKIKFSWQTDCSHLQTGTNCASGTTYRFYFDVYDDFCRVPGRDIATAIITVLPDSAISLATDIDSMLSSPGQNILYWKPYSGTGFVAYYVNRLNPATNRYEVIASLPGISTTSFTDINAGSIDEYFITVDSGICINTTNYSNVRLQATKMTMASRVNLDWNDAARNVAGNIKYYIYRAPASGTFTLIDSTTNVVNYTDSLLPCVDTIIYQVKTYINGQYYTTSNIDTVELINLLNYNTSLVSLSADTSGSVLAEWNMASGLGSYFYGYILYVATDSTGPYTIVDTVFTLAQTQYFHLKAGADTASLYYYVRILGHSDCAGDTLSKRSNILGTLNLKITSLNNGNFQLNWNPFFRQNPKSVNGYYYISRKYLANPYTLVDSTVYGAEQLTDTVIICNEPVVYKVEMDTMNIHVESESFINISGYAGKLELVAGSILEGPSGGVNYHWLLNGDPITSAGNSKLHEPAENGTYKLIVQLNNGCLVTTNDVIVMNIGIDRPALEDEIIIYPNPHHGSFDITLSLRSDDRLQIEVTDYNGKKVYVHSPTIDTEGKNTFHVDMQTYPKGVYLINIHLNNEVITKKVVYE